VDLVEPGGRVVWIGLSGGPSLVDSRMVALKDVTAVGILSASPGLGGALQLFASGRVDPSPLVAAVIGLDEVADVLGGTRDRAWGIREGARAFHMTERVRCSVFVGASLDGFIARPDGAFDFLPENPEPHGFEEFFATVDAMVMGRKTYETALAFEPWPYRGKPVFVLSTRPLAPAPAGAVVEHVSGMPQEILAQLEARGIQHVYVDGGQTVQAFLRAGAIDRITITRVPVSIGSGSSIFGALGHDIRLQHSPTRHFPSDLVQSEYPHLPPD